jgi:hypothetical protein
MILEDMPVLGGLSPVPFHCLKRLQRSEMFGESVIAIQARVRIRASSEG